jgi:dipeptidyl aminopeptidase/acylaminoacyl peptidase
VRPEDLDLLSATGRPALTPDGALAVVAVVRPDTATDTYAGGLWVVPTVGGAPRRLTNGHRDGAPAVSPDGRRVAFLRAGKDTAPQVHVTGIAGGEPVALTDHPLGASAPVWSPDGSRLAYAARVPEPGRYGTEDGEGAKSEPDAEPPRLITSSAYRLDNLGFTRDRRSHLFVLDVPNEQQPGDEPVTLPSSPCRLTDGDADDESPAWSPDGSTIAFLSARHASREDDLRSGVYVVAADAQAPVTEPIPVAVGDYAVSAAQWLPDRRLVVVAGELGRSGRDFVARPDSLWVSEGPVADTVVPLRQVTLDDADLEAGDAADLVVVGGRVLVRELHRGAVRLLSVDPGAAQPSAGLVVVDGHLVVTGQAASADGSTVVVTVSTPDRPGDLAVVGDGELRWLTDTGRRVREAGLRPMREVTAASGDGHPVHGWVVLPDPDVHGAGPYPVLLTIHGGPFTQYDWGVFDESQVYAGAGYAVVRCNPRGSSGYGVEHGRSIRHAMGSVDADDVLAFLDHVLGDDDLPLDADRVGVLGGSYGGYMTALLTTRTDRFAAAVVERGYLDAGSFTGSSDIGWFFPEQYHGTPEAMSEQSPMTGVDKVTTPTLVIHSEHDWRTPVEQGQRWYAALRARGVPTELLLFPGEGHELTRSGRPRHRRQRFDHLLRWWSEHLPTDGGSDPDALT